MDEQLLNLLKSVDTPTVCNAIEVAQGRRGFNSFTRERCFALHRMNRPWSATRGPPAWRQLNLPRRPPT